MSTRAVVLITAAAAVAAVLSNQISERSRIPAPAIFLVAAAVASDVIPALGQLSVTTVQRVVTVALAVILFDGEMQIGWRWFRGAAREGAAHRPPSRAETLSGGSLPCSRSRPWPTSRSPPIRLDFRHDQGEVQRLLVGLVVILLVASALGYLLVPAAMLRIVGIDSNPQVTFLVRTLAAALLALSPGAWAARRRDGTSAQRGVLIGLAGYMFASSLVDLYGFINQVVGIASVPSIALRVILGAVLVWLIPARNGRQP